LLSTPWFSHQLLCPLLYISTLLNIGLMWSHVNWNNPQVVLFLVGNCGRRNRLINLTTSWISFGLVKSFNSKVEFSKFTTNWSSS
jgi:hypothetical protein